MTEQLQPEVTVGALILNPAGELLLIQSHKWKGKYTIPGGHIEWGEKAEDALRREAKEETGLDVDDIQFLHWQEFINDDAFWKPRHFIFLDFTCKSTDSDVRLNNEAEAYMWVMPEKVLGLPVDSYTANSIQKYLQKKETNEK